MNFDIKFYINHLAEELIKNFEFASKATTPGLIGSAKEKEVARKLEMLLPNSVGVGSGCVIDSFGNTSKQMDIIIYEKNFCPIFSINDSPETTYYACEGVVAVGEIKSTLNSKELLDIFEKSKSIKSLKRYSVAEERALGPGICFPARHYNSNVSFQNVDEANFDQQNKFLDQILFFSLNGTLGLKNETFIQKFDESLKNNPDGTEPNLICILNDGILFYLDSLKGKIRYQKRDADSYYFLPRKENNFQFLLGTLTQMISHGRTAPTTSFDRYLMTGGNIVLIGGIKKEIQSNLKS